MKRDFWLPLLGVLAGALLVVLLVYFIARALYASVTGDTSKSEAPGIFGWVQRKAEAFRDWVATLVTGRTAG